MTEIKRQVNNDKIHDTTINVASWYTTVKKSYIFILLSKYKNNRYIFSKDIGPILTIN